MKSDQEKLFAFEYQGGRDVTDRLIKVLNVKDFQTLAESLNIPKATISTWHSRNQTPFEIAVRIHLKLGVSLQWLLFGKGEMYEVSEPSISNDKVELPYFQLDNGELLDKGKMFFDPQFLDGMPDAEHLMLVEHEGKKLFVDTSNTKVISGDYLVSYSGLTTVNELHRMPNGKMFMSFNGKDVEVEDQQLEVLGKALLFLGDNK